jgi:hypothetical protein
LYIFYWSVTVTRPKPQYPAIPTRLINLKAIKSLLETV